ncbi:peptide/nickel transport system substrate-binding protein [Paenarthrobacter nitroguajacolicus]|uniref:ABC transporter substrate-binding protein n=1 Tax=Paenarthrobacter nitroguajacolicus TaxID=211146 RepID=UPI00285796F0|nr:ABC transporter substrate-binding protein [Paenarthrobacter nitroguajacolicus]MDR6989190.1 peptide/nickel transport system substrate-binding protein [Paenarthrobacter nitroguajacolicus]
MVAFSPIKKKIASSLAVLMAITLAGCTSGRADDAEAGKNSTLNVGLMTQVGSWDPAMLYSGPDISLWWGAVYDTFLKCTPDAKPSPGAAESFKISDDSRVLTMTMRAGGTFEDGTPIDAKAAKASLEHMRDGGGSFAGQLRGITIEVLDDRTVQLTSAEPRRTIASSLCLGAGIVASPAALASPNVDSVPVSSGPYVLDAANSTSGSLYTFHKRKDYWDAASYPNETVVMRQITDTTARLNALKSGELDVAPLDYTVAAEAEASGIAIQRSVGYYAGLHIADRAGKVVPALGDLRVRQAINMAFDREAIVKNLQRGEGIVSEQLMHPDSAGFVKELNDTYGYDLDKAKRLMAEAGYKDGFDLEIPTFSALTQTMNPMIIQQLSELNIRVKEVQLQPTTFLNDLLSGRFPVYFFQMGTTPDPMFTVEYSFAIWNSFGATDPKLQSMLDATQTLKGEEADRNFKNINRFWTEQAWFAPFYNTYDYLGLKSKDLLAGNTGPLGYPQLSDLK